MPSFSRPCPPALRPLPGSSRPWRWNSLPPVPWKPSLPSRPLRHRNRPRPSRTFRRSPNLRSKFLRRNRLSPFPTRLPRKPPFSKRCLFPRLRPSLPRPPPSPRSFPKKPRHPQLLGNGPVAVLRAAHPVSYARPGPTRRGTALLPIPKWRGATAGTAASSCGLMSPQPAG